MRLSHGLLLSSNANIQAWPGQPGNLVGYAATPNYPGSLRVWTGGNSFVSGTATNPTIYAFYDFRSGTTKPGVTISSSVSNVRFVGCRFQSNAASAWPAATSSSNVVLNGATNITFEYCSFTPLTSIATINPGYTTWPCSAAGTNANTQIPGTNAITETQAYTYGLFIEAGGPVTVDHCEFWGFGNVAIDFTSTTAQMIINETWMHDCAAEGPTYNQHQDAIGYLNGLVPCQNITIQNCTIAGMGNTNAIAFQGTNTASYHNIIVTGNYLTGFGYTATLPGGQELFGGDGISTITGRLVFTNNTFGTDVPWIWGPLYALYQGNFSTKTWYGNKFNVLPGSTPAPGSDWEYSFANNGNFIWPDSTFSTTDWPGH